MWWLNRFVIVLVVVGSLSGALTRISGQAAKPAASSANAGSASNADELRTMQDDVNQISALLTQMRANLGFVGGSTSPVYHEFDLEAQMWQALINQMDRRIAEMQKQNRGGK